MWKKLFGYLLRIGIILSKTKKNKKIGRVLGVLLVYPPLNMGMDARNSPFLGILFPLQNSNQALEF